MALPVYTYDSIPTDSEFNSFLRPTFVKDEGQEEFPGALLRLRDASLSNDPTQIKGRWQTFERLLLVSAGSGLTANYQGGIVTLPSGLVLAVSAGSLSIPNNATSFVFISAAGTVTSAATLPVVCVPLAQVTTVGGAITQVVDLRPRFTVGPITSSIKSFGGTGDQGDYTLSGTETFDQGEYYFRNFTINSTATLTISRAARIFVSGTCTIAGAIVTTTATSGGAAVSVAGNATVAIGRTPGGGLGGGSGSPGNTYNFVASLVGSGGASGVFYPTGNAADQGFPPRGGEGGGALLIECAGAVIVSGTISANGGNATSTPSGVSSGSPRIAGGGGGSGGLISIRSLSSIVVTNTATLNVRGGNGSEGVGALDGSNFGACGGCGGGGGQVLLTAPSVNTTGATINLNGGLAGANRSPGSPGYGGGAGGSFGGIGGNPFPLPANFPGAAGLLTVRLFRAVG